MQDYPVRKLLFKELLLGAINGLFTGLVAGAAMWWSAWHAHNPQAPLLALVIVTAMISACMLSGIFGVMVPLILKRSEEHTSELQSLMRISYAVFCLKTKKNERHKKHKSTPHNQTSKDD